jgi:hypothetical protein
LGTQLVKSGYEDVDERTVGQLIVALRTLVKAHLDKTHLAETISRWPELSYAVCRAEVAIRWHPLVRASMDRLAQEQRDLSYPTLVEMALQQAGEPLHWQQIAERAEAFGRRKNFSADTMMNSMIANSEMFVRVGPGTYGLAEWGLSEQAPFTDFVADLLLAEKRTMSHSELEFRIREARNVNPASVMLTLELGVRFYKAETGNYGLRAWLSPREMQTLRTPDYLVETESSFQRVARAASRGYHVEAVIARDKARMEELGVRVADIRA